MMVTKLGKCPGCGAEVDLSGDGRIPDCWQCGRNLVEEPEKHTGEHAAEPHHEQVDGLPGEEPRNFGGVAHHDYTGGKVGMWLFLFTELLLFGGMFIVYSIYRARYTAEFHVAAEELNTGIGALNTFLLLTSSLTVALSITAMQRGQKKLCLGYLWATILMGFGFLVNKYFEWSAKFHHGIIPGGGIQKLLEDGRITKGESVFYNLYFVMTGLHGLHVVVGLICLIWMVRFIQKDWVTKKDYGYLENSGLYWHLVDLIWIYLFPLFYLIS